MKRLKYTYIEEEKFLGWRKVLAAALWTTGAKRSGRPLAPFVTVYGYYNISRRENFLVEKSLWRRADRSLRLAPSTKYTYIQVEKFLGGEKVLAEGADRPTTHRNPISLTGAVFSHRGRRSLHVRQATTQLTPFP